LTFHHLQLSDVAQGGGTAFPQLRTLLKPKKYAGILKKYFNIYLL